MWKVKFIEDEYHQWCVYRFDESYYWYTCDFAHAMKDHLNALIDLGFNVDLRRI